MNADRQMQEHTTLGSGVPYTVVSPASVARPPALCLYLASGRRQIVGESGFHPSVAAAREAGLTVVAVDLPCHGDLERPGQVGIRGICAALVAGEQVVEEFNTRARSVLDDCVGSGLAPAERIGVAGTSRGGFFALHLMAADPRISAGVGFAPVTCWSELQEFADVRDHPVVTATDVIHLVPRLADRPVGIWIGGHDTRVGTHHARAVGDALAAAATRSDRLPRFVTAEYEGHTVLPEWHPEALSWLMEMLGGTGR